MPESPSYPPDPLIDEIREIRRKLSERFDNDVGKLCEHLREMERQHPERMATPEQLEYLRRRMEARLSQAHVD